MKRLITLSAIVIASVFLLSAQTPDTQLPSTDSCTDSRPFLKRWFKDFPVVYSDTAYTSTDYILVIKATLSNNSWHHHSGEKRKIKRYYTISDSILTNQNSLVKFVKPTEIK